MLQLMGGRGHRRRSPRSLLVRARRSHALHFNCRSQLRGFVSHHNLIHVRLAITLDYTMAISGSVWRLLLIGLVFHLVYIGTVFDCYFTSPVVHGMQQHSLDRGEARRLVLIVGGL